MHKILVTLLVVILSGCAASNKKTDSDIHQEALTAVAARSGQVQSEIMTVEIPSHGLIADQIVIGLGGGANATYLRDVLTQLNNSSERSVLIMGTSPSLNDAVIVNAVKDLDLAGMQIIYAGERGKQTQIAQAIKQTGAVFSFIDNRY